MKRGRLGLSIIEVIIAVAIIAIIMGILTTSVVGNLRRTSSTGGSTQAAQVLNYLSRRVAGGQNAVLPAVGTPLQWTYGTQSGSLSAAFPDLVTGSQLAPDLYRASIVNVGPVSLAGATLTQYDLEVCHERGGAERCVTGVTMGPSPSDANDPAYMLPGIN